MKPAKISVMDEPHILYSLPCENSSCGLTDGAVILLPSLTADFLVKTYSDGSKRPTDYYAAAVCAAAFLVLERGLPLSEITFETPSGNISISYTGGNLFSLTIPKCKFLFTNSNEIMGCEVKSSDVLVGARYRVIHTAHGEGFDTKGLPLFLTRTGEMPDAVVHSYFSDGELKYFSYADHSLKKPSSLSLFAAAAYNAHRAVSQERRFFHAESIAQVELSQVTVTVGAIIQK